MERALKRKIPGTMYRERKRIKSMNEWPLEVGPIPEETAVDGEKGGAEVALRAGGARRQPLRTLTGRKL